MLHFDPDLIVIALFAFSTVGLVTLGPIGRAIADRVRGRAALSPGAETQEQLDEVLAHLDDVQRQLGEITERQDFTERLLARARERGLLEAPK